jgi:hypothetical protein
VPKTLKEQISEFLLENERASHALEVVIKLCMAAEVSGIIEPGDKFSMDITTQAGTYNVTVKKLEDE